MNSNLAGEDVTMKAQLETPALTNRGVELESETNEEAAVLLRLWTEKGRPVSFTRLLSGAGFDIKTGIRLSIAPSAAEKD